MTLSAMADNVTFVDLVTSPPHDLPAAVSHIQKAITEAGMYT